ncbi:type IV toxin-antitoxin system AbiEi family antitoxin domain-containing protein [Raineyella sp.]|uniref:type IV toxin-antitoxin system AbiEi family antitoxin domain-containing protein n=1 Tax=Raineyella sp. TaxID=1911550 RepID=UPI002B1EA67B|nr:type IV toxin-antitoxin system AbiEi family antitoxin domain-containing protein [Raineyella sp.]MEA5153808.1 type IV toxin-antitoxin system AbiEi family antitoxin domain-containing protein [Raineyella sp.]
MNTERPYPPYPDLPTGLLLTPQTAAALGLDAHGLRAACRAGRLTQLRRGVYADVADLDPVERHRLRIIAAKEHLDPSAVLSHVSAAVWHGLEVPWDIIDDRVHITRGTAGGSIRDRLATHTGPLPADEWTVIDGLRVTTVARSVVDLARVSDVRDAAALADHALRRHGGEAQRADMERIVHRSGRRRGVDRARWVAGFADARAENGGESACRVVLASLGIPAPELQFEVRTARGALIGRADFAWPQCRTLGEFDGRVKYLQLPRAQGEDPGQVVFREKRREDRLRAADWEVVRWTWEDLERPDLMRQELLKAFQRGQQRLRV